MTFNCHFQGSISQTRLRKVQMHQCTVFGRQACHSINYTQLCQCTQLEFMPNFFMPFPILHMPKKLHKSTYVKAASKMLVKSNPDLKNVSISLTRCINCHLGMTS